MSQCREIPEILAMPDDADNHVIVAVDYISEVVAYARRTGKTVKELAEDQEFRDYEKCMLASVISRCRNVNANFHKSWGLISAWYDGCGVDCRGWP